VSRRQARLALLFLAAALVLLVWSVWLVITLPYRYLTTHWRTRNPHSAVPTTNEEGAV
jgi:hypothetical protein